MRRLSTYKMVLGGLFITLGIVLPQAFHLTGVSQSGMVFLPMHIPVFLTGMLLGPLYGLFVGLILPFLNFLLTGMPTSARMPFMMIELMSYGFVSGLLFHQMGMYKKKFGIYITLFVSMIIGRGVYAVALFIAAELLHIKCGGVMAAVTATVVGIFGIGIQFIFIPVIVHALRKEGGLLDKIRTGENPVG